MSPKVFATFTQHGSRVVEDDLEQNDVLGMSNFRVLDVYSRRNSGKIERLLTACCNLVVQGDRLCSTPSTMSNQFTILIGYLALDDVMNDLKCLYKENKEIQHSDGDLYNLIMEVAAKIAKLRSTKTGKSGGNGHNTRNACIPLGQMVGSPSPTPED